MKKVLATLLLSSLAASANGAPPDVHPQVRLRTSRGDIVLELDRSRAPVTVANFLSYVEQGFYDGTLFHRVIPGFMIQGGGLAADMSRKRTQPPIKNEADNGLQNLDGTIAMARTSDPNSATSQFFINVADNERLDHRSPDPQGWGYCVFGKVIQGMDVVHAISAVPTTSRAGHSDVPVTNVVIEHAEVIPAP
jgi:cyclophilin family peptidyl-prolyl cis-trans isomerase